MTHNQSDGPSDAFVVDAVLDGCGDALEALGGEADGFRFCGREILCEGARCEDYSCEQASNKDAGTEFGAAQKNLLENRR